MKESPSKKNKLSKFLKIIKWTFIIIFGFLTIQILILGHNERNSKTGIQTFNWSGLDALFKKDENFELSFEEKTYETKLKWSDGAYIFGNIKYSVDKNLKLIRKIIDRTKPLQISVNNEDNDLFYIKIKDSLKREKEIYNQSEKIIAIADIEGNFNAFQSFLIKNKIIDENYNWVFGNGHLVLNGDFFDRGKNVTQVLWLIYSLEKKAEKQGGKVHFINGNHEIMNLRGNVRYANHHYIELAKQISKEEHWDKASQFIYSEKSELGKWLRTKNVIEKIGKYIFVHAGLNKELLDYNYTISEINSVAKKYYGNNSKITDKKTKLIVKSYKSPYWDRSLVADTKYKIRFFLKGRSFKKPTDTELDKILNFYKAEKIVIGHSVVDEVSSDFNEKVIRIDVKHGKEKNSKKTQGLLIENGIEYRINGLGEKERI